MATQSTPTIYENWENSVTFKDKGPSPTTLLETPKLKAVLAGLRAGQAIPRHPSPEAVYTFLRGSGTMTVDDESYVVGPGAVVVVPAGSERGIIATTDIVFIGTTVPATRTAPEEP